MPKPKNAAKCQECKKYITDGSNISVTDWIPNMVRRSRRMCEACYKLKLSR